MNLATLELFCEGARVKSFAKAAKLLNLSQSSVSAKMQAVEDFYGVSLFNRSHSGVTLTEFGEVVYRYARQILKLHEEMAREIDSLSESENQKLAIGASLSVGNQALPCTIWAFTEKHPKVEVVLRIKNAETIVSMVRDEEIHLGILEERAGEGMADLVTKQVLNDELLVITANRKPWTERSSISLEELKSFPVIIREKGSGIRCIFEKLLESSNLSLGDFKVVAEMESIDAIKSAVAAGMGLSLCSRIAARREIRDGSLHALKIGAKPISINYLLAYKSEEKLSASAKRFIRFLVGPGEIPFC